MLKYSDFIVQNVQSEARVTREGRKFGHLGVVGLHVFVSLFVTPINRRSSHGWLAVDSSSEPLWFMQCFYNLTPLLDYCYTGLKIIQVIM